MIPNKKIGDWEIRITIAFAVILTILILVEFKYPCIADRYSTAFSVFIGFLTGIISAIDINYI